MNLQELLSRFDRNVRERGIEYARDGHVRLDRNAPANEINAVVTGFDRYDVSIRVRGKRLVLYCSCPFFADNGPCKHLAATAIVADQRGRLSAIPSGLVVTVEPSESDGFDDEPPDDEPADEPADESSDDASDDDAGATPAPSVFNRPRPRPVTSAPPAPPPPRPAPPAPQPEWSRLLDVVGAEALNETPASLTPPGELFFVIDADPSPRAPRFALSVCERAIRKDGNPGKLAATKIRAADIRAFTDPNVRALLALMRSVGERGGIQYAGYFSPGSVGSYVPSSVDLTHENAPSLLSLADATRRLFVRATLDAEPAPLRYDAGDPWQLILTLTRDANTETSTLTGSLRRGAESAPLTMPLALHESGWLVTRDSVARFEHFDVWALAKVLRTDGKIIIPRAQETAFVEKLLRLPTLPPITLPSELNLRGVALTPEPILRIVPFETIGRRANNVLEARVTFAYGNEIVHRGSRRAVIPRVAEGVIVRRDLAFEDRATARLAELNFRKHRWGPFEQRAASHERFEIAPRYVAAAVRALVLEGWRVEAQGQRYRQASPFQINVTSGVDWFELNATVDFGGGAQATLPELLAAVVAGDGTVRLGDGTFGLIPEEWLAKYAMLARVGRSAGRTMRFGKNQVGLLDALLAADDRVVADDPFERAREELRRFEGIQPENPRETFRGALRPYQCLGLGWFSFLRRFGFGGCLADDMGLGKTVQVLAMLDARRGETKKPSLVVMPKSLVWNWRDEAARFAPKLDVYIHTGTDRVGRLTPGALRLTPGPSPQTERGGRGEAGAGAGAGAGSGSGREGNSSVRPEQAAARNERGGVEGRSVRPRHDVILTTYGTLRQDIAMLSEIDFDYVILDEAQAIKNASSDSAKASRLLRADHRLALSGTPVENHLGELWSIFEFLNPGMLGSARAFDAARGASRTEGDEIAVLTRALRPFVLRRTKEQVAPELPPKHEETLVCELDTDQRRLYDQLRDHYRKSLLGRIDRDGMARSKIQVLEALLRLRQAACHPALVDKGRVTDPSAKLEMIVERLLEVRNEGHKALVFSQFTSFLDIVRRRLESEKLPYEYLDGKTVDREARVQRFQTDPECPVFLVSLKAGGVGLNLTAADYVFILDPWWNPAVEAQAVDRAHRIGQTKHVFVYRLICRDTVEEKVAALQESKRGLADSIINADESLIRGMDRETLEALLG